MMDDKDLYRQLNNPDVPGDLEKKIRANWLDQKAKQRPTMPVRQILVAASVVVLIAGAVLTSWLTTPNDLISIAINDINNDEKQHIGMTMPIDAFVKQANIHLPPASMPVEMIKQCNLNGNKTMHVKVAGANQGAVHLFINKGDFTTSLWTSNDDVPAMPWRLIKPRKDLSVLVVYTKDMNPASVDKLIQTMFYA